MLYLDSSAIVKLVLEESESQALRAWLGERALSVTSGLASVEVRRTIRVAEMALAEAADRRPAARELGARADAVLSGIVVLEVDDAVLGRAARIDPLHLRTLDAVHLASALSLEDLEAFVTYDRELGQAASLAGLTVAAPGS